MRTSGVILAKEKGHGPLPWPRTMAPYAYPRAPWRLSFVHLFYRYLGGSGPYELTGAQGAENDEGDDHH
jgi:hypothetical protein